MQLILFYFFAAIAVFSALGVILLPKPTRALMSLIAAMVALSLIYLLLGAAFVAMVHLIVYAGAILILFLFVIMLQGIGATELPLSKRFPAGHVVLAGIAGLGFLGVILKVLISVEMKPAVGVLGTVEAVGESLLRNYLLPFELTSLLLLVGIFAAVSLAKKDANPPETLTKGGNPS